MIRRITRTVRVGRASIGGGAAVSVQTMAKVPTADPARVLRQIESLVAITPSTLDGRGLALLRSMGLLEALEEISPVACDFVRVGLPDERSADALKEIVPRSPLPIVADIHLKARLALLAVEAGVHKIRINPGNLGGVEPTRRVARACGERGIPIRVGINAGSLEGDLKSLFAECPEEALVRSAMRNIGLLEDGGFRDIVVSMKEHSAATTSRAYRRLAEETDCPFHLGVTEAGMGESAVINSALGVLPLLRAGIGDTVRVSLTEEPALEVVVGRLLVNRAEQRSGEDQATDRYQIPR